MHKTTVARYGSVAELLAAVERAPAEAQYHNKSAKARDGWTSEGFAETVLGMRLGRRDYAAKIASASAKLGDTYAQKRPQWVRGAAGYLPSVPAYLGGSPRHMLRRVNVQQSGSPSRVYVSLAAHVSLTPEIMAARGAAILRLITTLQDTRPVELYMSAEVGTGPIADSGAHIMVTRIDPRIIDRDVLAYLLCSVSVFRGPHFAIASEHDFNTKYAWAKLPDSPEYIAKVQEAIGFQRGDLYITGATADDGERIMNDPVAWVQSKIDIIEGRGA